MSNPLSFRLEISMSDTTFTVTEDHLKLLRCAYVGWDDCEFGAPAIDCKRPYGNSDVITDIAEILHPGTHAALDEEAYDRWEGENRMRLYNLHRETQTVLQIAISTGEFRTGMYRLPRGYGRAWERVGE